MRILIADDDPFYRCLLQRTLSDWGYEVIVTADGEAAWQALQRSDAPKLAILDWLMPGLDGLELCRRVRGLRQSAPPYLILLTVKGNKGDIVAGLEAGADDYMAKPFDLEELRARLVVAFRIVGLQANLAARVRELEEALCGTQKLESIGRLAGGVAHDFNNLLTVIIGFSDALLGQLPENSEPRSFATEIRKAGERAAGLTRQLLAFSRKTVLAPVELQFNDLVTNMEPMLRRLIREDVELQVSLDPALGSVRADPGQMEQVLMNLVVNAGDAMPKGGHLRIETSEVEIGEAGASAHPPFEPGRFAVLAVTDTGCGMDGETKAHIFEPFFTTKEAGKGTGLGLATVYGIVKQSGGHLDVYSEPGRGSTFRIYLPRVESSEPRLAAPTALVPSSRKGTETILVVEDEDELRNLARMVLQAEGYTVLEARNSREALHNVEHQPRKIDLLLTDVIMPGMNGRALAAQLQSMGCVSKVLYMSGYTDDVLTSHDLPAEGFVLLEKPFSLASLTSKVRQVLDSSSVPV